MKKIIKLCLLLFVAGIFQACEYNWIEFEKVDPDVTVSFSEKVEPIFTNKGCIGCHPGTGGFSLKVGEAYQSIISRELVDTENPETSILLLKSHAASEYTSSDEELILVWIQQGALDN